MRVKRGGFKVSFSADREAFWIVACSIKKGDGKLSRGNEKFIFFLLERMVIHFILVDRYFFFWMEQAQ